MIKIDIIFKSLLVIIIGVIIGSGLAYEVTYRETLNTRIQATEDHQKEARVMIAGIVSQIGRMVGSLTRNQEWKDGVDKDLDLIFENMNELIITYGADNT